MFADRDIFDSELGACDVFDSPFEDMARADLARTEAESRVHDALVGGPSVPFGATFLDHDALAGLRWSVAHDMPRLLAALVDQADLDFVFVPAWEIWADEASDRVAAAGGAVLWVVPGPLGVVAARDGWSETLRRTARDPEALKQDMRAELPHLAEYVRRGARLQVTAIVVAEDLAGAEGMLIAPDHATDVVFPLLQTIVDTAAEEGLLSIWHTDGDTRALLTGARRAGFVAVHSGGLPDSGFDRFCAHANNLGLSVLGGISGDAVREGGPAALQAGSLAAIRAQRGGFLLCDDGGLSTAREVSELLSALGAARPGVSEEGGE